MQITKCLGALIVHKFDQSFNQAVGKSISTWIRMFHSRGNLLPSEGGDSSRPHAFKADPQSPPQDDQPDQDEGCEHHVIGFRH